MIVQVCPFTQLKNGEGGGTAAVCKWLGELKFHTTGTAMDVPEVNGVPWLEGWNVFLCMMIDILESERIGGGIGNEESLSWNILCQYR